MSVTLNELSVDAYPAASQAASKKVRRLGAERLQLERVKGGARGEVVATTGEELGV